MRVLTLSTLAAAGLFAAACAAAPADSPQTATSGDDCAVVAAIAKEHFRFGPDNPPPPLKPGGEEKWKPQCDFSAQGFSFTSYVEPAPGSDPRQALKWVSFQKPRYDGNGAIVPAEIMHGPLAGMGYECRVHSGIAGWTVGECRVSWVS